MIARQWMSVLVRMGGLVLLVLAIQDGALVLWLAVGGTESAHLTPGSYLYIALQVVLGLFFARQSDWVVDRFRWPEETAAPSPDSVPIPPEAQAIAFRAAGLLALLLSVSPLTRLIRTFIDSKHSIWTSADTIVPVVLYAAFATWTLMLSARRRKSVA